MPSGFHSLARSCLMLHSPTPTRLACLLTLFYLAACSAPPRLQTTASPGPYLARAHFVTSDGLTLPVRTWLPSTSTPRAVLIAVHGFNDYSRAFEQPGRYLSERGIAVYAYDQRGFGNSPGRGRWAGTDRYAADLREFTAAVRRRQPNLPVFVLGESMGGAVVVVALAGNPPLTVDGAILVAPAVWDRGSMPWYQRTLLAAAAATLPELELTGEGLEIQASDNLEILRGLSRDPLVIKGTRVAALAGLADLMDAAQAGAERIRRPVLVLYGARDQVIPKEPIIEMLRRLPAGAAPRVGYYPSGYHLLLRDLHAEHPVRDIAAWIDDRCRPLPSGAERAGARLLVTDRGNSGACRPQVPSIKPERPTAETSRAPPRRPTRYAAKAAV